MSKLAELRRKAIERVVSSLKASQIEGQAIEDEFDSDLSEFLEKYGEHLSDEERQLLGGLAGDAI